MFDNENDSHLKCETVTVKHHHLPHQSEGQNGQLGKITTNGIIYLLFEAADLCIYCCAMINNR